MNEFKNGSVKISTDIIDQLIAETALADEAVAEVLGYKNRVIDKKKKDGIVSVIQDTRMSVAISVVIKSDHNILECAERIQEEIKKQVYVMLGLQVEAVHVFVKALEYK